MADYFIISSDLINDDDRRLLSYSGVTKGGKLVLTLKIEVDGWHMGQSLKSLEAIHAAHNPKPAPKGASAKRKSATTPTAAPLALPPPQSALPGPLVRGQ